ncbi:hypothetical protein [Colwellia sp. RSH04]|nr:hypothetical protein [Colwellia sp. RSH04]
MRCRIYTVGRGAAAAACVLAGSSGTLVLLGVGLHRLAPSIQTMKLVVI